MACHQRQIKQLWRDDESFRELAQDYALCLEVLTRWSTKRPPPGQLAEYLSLRRQLELEIAIFIQKAQPGEAELLYEEIRDEN